MNNIISKIEKMMMPIAAKISGNKYLLAMRDSFSTILPFMIVGSIFGIINWVVLDPTGTIMGESGLNLGHIITGLSGEEYLASGFVAGLAKGQQLCALVTTIGFDVFSLLLVIAFSYRLGGIWGGDQFTTALVGLSAFLIVTPQSVENVGGFSTAYFGNKAVLTGIVVATVASWIFVKLAKNDKLTIKMPASVPPAVSKSFAALVPVGITLGGFALFSALLIWFSQPALNDLIYMAIQAPLMGFSQGIGFSLLYQFLVWFFWWFGIHGHNVTAAIANSVYMPAQLANQTGEAAYIFSNGFFEAGLMQVMGLVIAILIFSKKEDLRAVTKVGAPAMLFNIQEPLAFGLPIVLNPMLMIPYIVAPLVNTVIGWAAITWLGFPVFRFAVPWTMPLFFGGLVGTGSVMGGVLQLIWLAVDVVIYAPFVIAMNRSKEA
ncbi:MAG: PTS sugar transporter subunit IIC [Clostridium sp.]